MSARFSPPACEPVKSQLRPSDCQGTDGALGGAVVDGDGRHFEEECEGVPSGEAVADGFFEVGLAGNFGQAIFEPGFERLGEWRTLGLAGC